MTKATFETRDTHAAFGVSEPHGEKKYVGLERRHKTRRCGEDRRTEYRFEPNAVPDRRENKGRREDDYTPDFF